MQAQAPLVQVCPAPQVMVAHGSVTGLPPMLLSSLPAEPPTLETEPAPPAATLMPPLASAPLLPLDASELPAPAFAGAPLELRLLLPAPPAASLVPPELQATSQSTNAEKRIRGLCCFNQE